MNLEDATLMLRSIGIWAKLHYIDPTKELPIINGSLDLSAETEIEKRIARGAFIASFDNDYWTVNFVGPGAHSTIIRRSRSLEEIVEAIRYYKAFESKFPSLMEDSTVLYMIWRLQREGFYTEIQGEMSLRICSTKFDRRKDEITFQFMVRVSVVDCNQWIILEVQEDGSWVLRSDTNTPLRSRTFPELAEEVIASCKQLSGDEETR